MCEQIDNSMPAQEVLWNDPLPSTLVESFHLMGRLIYVIPEELVKAIQNVLAGVIKDRDRELEIELAREATKRNAIAFRNGCSIAFSRLALFPLPVDPDLLQGAADPVVAAKEINDVLVEANGWCQAYMGWLLQNQDYRSDISTLAKIGCDYSSPLGTPPPYPEGVDGDYDQLFCAEHRSQVRVFCRKWRLDGFKTLDLPIPLEPHFVCSPYNQNSRDGGSTPFIPDIYPIKGRGEVLDRIRASQPTQVPGHLVEWMDLIAPSSKKSPRLTSLARQFRLQHYWRVLHDRYAENLAGKKGRLYQAFAEFFDENEETIRKEVPKLKECLDVPLSVWQ